MHPDESLAVTVLVNDPQVRVDGNDLRYVSWTHDSPHPDLLTLDRLGEVLASGQYLARKFDASVDEAVLDELDRRLGVSPTAAVPVPTVGVPAGSSAQGRSHRRA